MKNPFYENPKSVLSEYTAEQMMFKLNQAAIHSLEDRMARLEFVNRELYTMVEKLWLDSPLSNV